MGDQDVFTTPQQNILIAKALIDTIEPLLGDDHAAIPITARIKAIITAAAIQHHQEDNQTPSASRAAFSRHSSGWDRDRGNKQKGVDAHSVINLSKDTRN